MPPFASVLRNRQFQIGTQTAWRIDWLMDDLGMRYIEGELSVGGPEHPGVAAFRYDFAGMEFAEYYNMLYHRAADGNEFLVFVGCGGSQTRAAGVGYSIGMVLSRELVTELPDSVAKEINDAMVLVGLDPLLDRMDVRDWCPTVYQSCPRDGWESWLEMLEHH
jgi:hypothetical protein